MMKGTGHGDRGTTGLLAGVLLAGLMLFGGAGLYAQTASGADAQLQTAVNKSLDNKKFKDVKSSVQDGVVTLTGTVDLYSAKADAEKRATRTKGVKQVQDQIQVAGPTVEDAKLFNDLAKKLTYDRVGYGTTAFNAITLEVHDGVVTLGGNVYGPTDKNSALDLVAYHPGVKGLVDHINTDPLSPMDDRIRAAEFRAIYGASQLNRYAIDPAKPIRISVANGNVTLSGMVDSQSDKDVAGIKANGVPGVFKVTNNLQVAGGGNERK